MRNSSGVEEAEGKTLRRRHGRFSYRASLPADANKALLRAIAWSPFLRDAERRHEAWERRFERLAK